VATRRGKPVSKGKTNHARSLCKLAESDSSQSPLQHEKHELSASGEAGGGDRGGDGGGGGDGDYVITLDMAEHKEGGEAGGEGEGGASEVEQAKGGAARSRPVQFVAHQPRVFACLREVRPCG